MALPALSSSLLPDRLAGDSDTVTRGTAALTCPWHLPKRINQSHSAAASEEPPQCSLPGWRGCRQRGHCLGGLLMPDVFIICLPGSEECLEGLLSSRGDGALWQCRCPDKGRGSPGELLLSEERRHLESEAKPCWDCCAPIPQPLSLPSLCCPAAGISTASPAGCALFQGEETAQPLRSPPCPEPLQESQNHRMNKVGKDL